MDTAYKYACRKNKRKIYIEVVRNALAQENVEVDNSNSIYSIEAGKKQLL